MSEGGSIQNSSEAPNPDYTATGFRSKFKAPDAVFQSLKDEFNPANYGEVCFLASCISNSVYRLTEINATLIKSKAKTLHNHSSAVQSNFMGVIDTISHAAVFDASLDVLGSQTAVAKFLGINRGTLRKNLKITESESEIQKNHPMPEDFLDYMREWFKNKVDQGHADVRSTQALFNREH